MINFNGIIKLFLRFVSASDGAWHSYTDGEYNICCKNSA